MIIYKRLLAVILAILTVLNISTVFASDSSKTDQNVLDFLYALKVMTVYEDGIFKSDSEITKAEMAAYISRILNHSDINDENISCYTDVAPDYWASGNIAYISGLGIISGNKSGEFNPDEPITYEQAAKMLVITLGYKVMAESNGGYPSGYAATASQIGLFKNTSWRVGFKLTRGDAAQMLYNALNTDVMEMSSFGASQSYSVKIGKTLLTDNLNIQKKSGILTASHISSITEVTADKGKVLIDNIPYKIADIDVEDCIGLKVDILVGNYDDIDNKTIMWLKPDDDDNTFIDIDQKTIDINATKGFGNPLDDAAFVYYDEQGKIQRETISKNTSVIVNGRFKAYASNIDTSSVIPKSGYVRLINNGNYNGYNLMLVNSYDYYVVDALDSFNSIIYDRFGKESLKLDSKDTYMLKNDSVIDFSSINVGDVLAVQLSNAQAIKATVVPSFVSGSIIEITEDGLMIDNKFYEFSDYLNPINISACELDKTGEFYIGLDGRIVIIDLDATDTANYAYLVKAAVVNGLNKEVQFKMFTAANSMQVFSCKDEITFNGVSGLKPINVLLSDKLSETSLRQGNKVFENVKQQLVKYKLNADNKIIEINTADTQESSSSFKQNLTGAYTYASNGTLDINASNEVYKLSANAVAFGILGNAGSENEDDYQAFSVESIGGWMYLDIYDIDENGLVPVVVNINGFSSGVIEDTSVIVVDHVARAVNTESENVYRVIGWRDGKTVSVLSKDDKVGL